MLKLIDLMESKKRNCHLIFHIKNCCLIRSYLNIRLKKKTKIITRIEYNFGNKISCNQEILRER